MTINIPLTENLVDNPLLLQLRDLHLPAPVNAWPLAPGWWLVLGLAITLTWLITRYRIRRWRAHSYLRQVNAALERLHQQWQSNRDASCYLSGANAVMRQLALTSQGRSAVASLTAERWLATLDQLALQRLTPATQTALTQACYTRAPTVDVEQVHHELLAWLKSHQRLTQGRHQKRRVEP